MPSTESGQPQQAVRFSSVNEEIDPVTSLQHVETLASNPSAIKEELGPEAQEELRNLSMTLQNSRFQARRMENFSFEPVSLPASRAPSPASASRTLSGHSGYHSGHSGSTPRPSPPTSAMHSPPLTPAGTLSQEGKTSPEVEQRKGHLDPAMMTPQVSPPHEPPPTSMDIVYDQKRPGSIAPTASPRQVAEESRRPKSLSDVSGVVATHPRHAPTFTVGPAGDSLPPSRDPSPSGSPGTQTPGTHTPGTSTPAYSRPFTPSGDRDDPYARNKRPPQPRNLDALDARFIFGGRDSRRSQNYSSSTSTAAQSRSRGSAAEIQAKEEKRHSFFGGGKHHHANSEDSEITARIGISKQHGSMSELKRFFKLGGHKHSKDSKQSKEKRTQSPAPSVKVKSIRSNRSGVRTPPSSHGSVSVPFADDHGLQSKYGKFGKVLGSGAGGSVRLMKRSSDGTTFAVKQFRARHSYETEREYNKKVTAEFCVGSTLHHGNIIETMDLVHEKGSWYVVMEYAPFDLFAIVMTGKMSREEISCATLQILNGVTYLHSMGLAHRDLKLDNVVVNEHGIMKIIDFGSAAVFRYPFENDLVLASGIVGSDPYLAPEVYDLSKYDPQPTDIWSLAIIFCCMTLRRFPWKAPRLSDNSYKLFVSPPNDGPRRIDNPSKSTSELQEAGGEDQRQSGGPYSEPASRESSDVFNATNTGHHHHHHHHRNKTENQSDPVTNEARPKSPAASTQNKEQQQQIIKGPWRLLRLLPRESRHVIGRMLEVDPKKRATMEEILQDKWVSETSICRQEEGGAIIRAEGHEHTLEPGTGASAPSTSQNKK
ncbi:Pkinase-domain-containing protein [Lepidopterella palustris CBS 459.81]|uniref:non-specific serine/threonine protein kinase n=1 Tax=Lepidopterella palustris CBS 459.81 TaxID=1314670 RepID=A0A8E2E575_9PEZI|nr:Pkinase-domain-containing protein [Lepidopterella palustris CBS 459.81]